MKQIKTTKFDPAKYLDTEVVQTELLSEALETSNAEFITHAKNTVERDRQLKDVLDASSADHIEVAK